MIMEEQKHNLLYSPVSVSDETFDDGEISALRPKRTRYQLKNIFMFALLAVSIGLNILFWFSHFINQDHELERKPKDFVSHNRLNLVQDIHEFQRWRFTSYSHPNETIRDAAWDSIDVDRSIVAVDKKEATAMGLSPTRDFPWDDSKGLYIMNAYHQQHCLKLLYRSFQEAHHGKEFSNAYDHILHCLDSLRGDFECMADDHLFFVMPGFNPPVAEGQMMQCRNFSRIDEFAASHHSCFSYQYINDKEPESVMHQFRNCPEGSPYMEKMKQYFGYGKDWKPDFDQNFGPEFEEGMDDKVEA